MGEELAFKLMLEWEVAMAVEVGEGATLAVTGGEGLVLMLEDVALASDLM